MLHRSGVTLTEVLVAIMIMGIGLLSILVLFPLGAMDMYESVRDDRSAQYALNASVIAKIAGTKSMGVRDDDTVFPKYTSSIAQVAPIVATTLPALTTGSGPSYPVYVDPIGVNIGSTRVGALTGVSPGFVRSGHSEMTTNLWRVRWCCSLDEIDFDIDGKAKLYGASIRRENRYSWGWMCQQIQANQGPAPTPAPGVNLTVVVYDKRPWRLINNLPAGETNWAATFTAGTPIVNLSWAAGATSPRIRPGTWILDATMTPEIHCYFYRVLNYTSTGATSMNVELQTNALASATPGVAVLMDNVIEVFERGTN